MKKIIICLFVSLVTLSVFAESVNPDDAGQMAQNYLSSHSLRSNSRKATTSNNVRKVQNPYSKDVKYFVFQRDGGGFVVMAADNVAKPILAYSETGTFDFNNEGAMFFLNMYDEEIQLALEQGIKADEQTLVEWEKLANNTLQAAEPVVGPLIQTAWDQEPYYNDKTPIKGGEHTLTGCVATAMAQVMRYWEFPINGRGTHSYNLEGYGTVSANFGNTTYDWNNMPTQLDEYSTNVEVSAVSTLMFHCGVSVDMQYSLDGSSSSNSKVPDALKNYFGYKGAVLYLSKDGCFNWEDLLQKNLDKKMPLVYNGGPLLSKTGHSFVCDGYDTNNKFHFNFGWSGRGDGFYSLSAIIVVANLSNFTNNQGAVFEIEPAFNYQICVNGKTYYDTDKIENDAQGRTQYRATDVYLHKNDIITFYDAAYGRSWVIPTIDPYGSYKNFSSTQSGIKCNVEGCYDLYMKLKYDDDVIYIGEGAHCSPMDIEEVTTTSSTAVKLLRNGTLLINRNGKTYNAQGAVVE